MVYNHVYFYNINHQLFNVLPYENVCLSIISLRHRQKQFHLFEIEN